MKHLAARSATHVVTLGDHPRWRLLGDENFRTSIALYVLGTLTLVAAVKLRAEPEGIPNLRAMHPLARALARGDVGGVPRLAPDDGMANSALLSNALGAVPEPGAESADSTDSAFWGGQTCRAAPRLIALFLDKRLSRVHFGARTVCQLQVLKRVSAAQPVEGGKGIGEVAAFLLGRRDGEQDVHVTRVIVPPFHFTSTTLTFLPADLGPLAPGERFIGTYHTHPEGDLEQGVLSDVDLNFIHTGEVDFHGAIGPLYQRSPDLEWLFDIVEPRDGEWNVYAHDRRRLVDLWRICANEAVCPLNQLRITGSPFYLLTRYYEER